MLRIGETTTASAPNLTPPQSPLVTVLLGASGPADKTLAALGRIRATCSLDGPAQVVVIDNAVGLHGGLLDADIEHLALHTPTDWDTAWTAGLNRTRGQFVVLVSDDVVLEDNWLVTILSEFAAAPKSNAASPCVLNDGVASSSNEPNAGHGVCLVLRKAALESGAALDVTLVPNSRVLTSLQSAQTFVEPVIEAPAPGGGAPEGADVIVGRPADMATKHTRLHLGCGTSKIIGWTNVDGDAACRPDMTFDLTQRMPFADGTIERIYSEHLFEHFPLEQGIALMAECFRVLSPTGVMRVAMPNLRESVEGYLSNWAGQEWVTWFPEIDTSARALNMAFSSWGHKYLYDIDDLSLRLRNVGFTRFEIPAWGTSKYPELCELETRRESNLLVEVMR